MELQERVKEFLKTNGIKKNRLSALLGIYRQQLYSWFKGEYELSPSQVELVKKFVSGDYIQPIQLE